MKKVALMLCALLLASPSAFAAGERKYEVTITNLTAGQAFTPVLAATHKPSISFFELGQPASMELEILAEGGNTMPLSDLLGSVPNLVMDTSGTGGLLLPGKSMTFTIYGSHKFSYFSFAAMMLPTHDNIVAINTVRLPWSYLTTYAKAYDVGTEYNDEMCENIPGPPCMGEGYNEESGEGFVHVANGVHGVVDPETLEDGAPFVDPILHDWRNPVAMVSIKRLRTRAAP